ncbi:unnamed protein product [Clavelina lepadiformis]|uniref:Transmembrane protein 223 n=1 Tax=Clavelina lepadiformis TaxID=159417 RepID=A0ABP0FDM0_CLALP
MIFLFRKLPCTSLKFSSGTLCTCVQRIVHQRSAHLRKQLWKRSCRYYSAPAENNQTADKAFLIYNHLNYSLRLPRLFALTGVIALGISALQAIDLRELYENMDEEVAKDYSSSRKIYGGSFGRAVPYIFLATAGLIYYVSTRFVNSTVKKILLSTDRQTITLVSYRLIGRQKVLTFPTEDASLQGNKIKIKNHASSFYVSDQGTIFNKSLFESAFGVSRGVSIRKS